MKHLLFFILIPFIGAGQGSFDPAVGKGSVKAIYKDSSIIKSWASEVKVIRGYKDIAFKSNGKVNYGKPEYATGKSDARAISLGDSGVGIVTYSGIVFNGVGPDFCVFENSFDDYYLELAFVEVSSNGRDFVRFNSISETDTTSQIGSFDLLNADEMYNLAGKYRGQYGVPFDLEELKNDARINVDSITHIRVVDVIGAMDNQICSRDSKGNKINDPYPTDFQNNGYYTGGFDLEAVGLINYKGEIFLGNEIFTRYNTDISVYPNPASHWLSVQLKTQLAQLSVIDVQGNVLILIDSGVKSIDISELSSGLYWLKVKSAEGVSFVPFIKQ